MYSYITKLDIIRSNKCPHCFTANNYTPLNLFFVNIGQVCSFTTITIITSIIQWDSNRIRPAITILMVEYKTHIIFHNV